MWNQDWVKKLRVLRARGALAAFAMGAALLAGCGGESPGSAPGSIVSQAPPTVGSPSGETSQALVISQRGDALTLDPYDENETPTFAVLTNIFDPLVDADDDLNLVPGLAESWEAIDDTTWEFKLREGVVFHGGQPFTAEDVVFSIDRAQNWPDSEAEAEIVTVAGSEAIDAHTVRVTTHAPDPILLNRLTAILIMDKESSESAIAAHGQAHMIDHPNGTGPYQLVEWVRDDHLTLRAFDDHWGGVPEIREVIFRPISNDTSRLAALLAGDVHLITDVPVRDTRRIETTRGLKLLQRPSLRLIYLGLDCGRDESPGLPDSPPSPLLDRRVREAIYLAIDEESIVEHVMYGFAVPAGQLVPDTVFGYDPSIERPPHDRERARELLAEAGFPDGFRVRLDGPNDRYVNDASIAEAIASQLARVGIQVDVSTRPKTIFFEDEEQSECSMFLVGWSNSNGDASGTFEYLLHTNDPEKQLGGANSSTQYSNPVLDAHIQEAARTVDRGAREEIMHQCMHIAMHDLPHVPLHYQIDLYGVVDRLQWDARQDRRLRAFEMHWSEGQP